VALYRGCHLLEWGRRVAGNPGAMSLEVNSMRCQLTLDMQGQELLRPAQNVVLRSMRFWV
jgi:hypothetical protein